MTSISISVYSSISTTLSPLSLPYQWQDSHKWQNNNILWVSTKFRVEWTPFRAQMCTFEKSTLTSLTSGVAQTLRDISTLTCHTPLWSPWNVQQNAGYFFLILDQKTGFWVKNSKKWTKKGKKPILCQFRVLFEVETENGYHFRNQRARLV